MTRAIVLRAPGVNCDREAVYACRLAGFDTDLVHINELSKQPDRLLDYHFLLLPGGFSYADDLGAGNLMTRKLMLHLGKQLRQFVDEGRPVLGICNGFQVLVRFGLLPGVFDDTGLPQRATLTENELARFECRWTTLATQPSACIFTRDIDRPLEIPVAHGEGRFVFSGDIADLEANGMVPLVYATATGRTGSAVSYPENPNGSAGNIAGVCNKQGNVLGLMPHPERYVSALQHPQHRGLANGEGDGLIIFQNAYSYAQQFSRTMVAVSAPTPTKKADTGATSYADSGVHIDAAEQAKQLMKKSVQASHGPEVLAGIGAFAGAFSAEALKKMQHPALVASTDGVGTKTLIAAQARRYDTIGYDIVNHSVNDLVTQGARPLFFLDYIATSQLDPVQVSQIVESVAKACQEAGCALIGGETAEMPDVYVPGAFDLAGTIVGVVERNEMTNPQTIEQGDVLLGFPSNGLHTNGYSLARKLLAPYSLDTVLPELGESLVDALLRPHRSYLHEIMDLRSYLAIRGRIIKGMAHITGGGFQGNISRILPTGLQAVIQTASWKTPPLFQLLARLSNLPKEELYQTFNMGIGMVLVLSPKAAVEARSRIPELIQIGRIEAGQGVVIQ